MHIRLQNEPDLLCVAFIHKPVFLALDRLFSDPKPASDMYTRSYSLFLFSSTLISGGTIFSFRVVAGLKIIYSPPSYSS